MASSWRQLVVRPEDAAHDPLQVKDARRQPASFLISLRDRGLLRLDDGRIMMSGRGKYLMAGPCDLTAAGRGAHGQDRRLGPRL